jgi:hypothetical protein
MKVRHFQIMMSLSVHLNFKYGRNKKALIIDSAYTISIKSTNIDLANSILQILT